MAGVAVFGHRECPNPTNGFLGDRSRHTTHHFSILKCLIEALKTRIGMLEATVRIMQKPRLSLGGAFVLLLETLS